MDNKMLNCNINSNGNFIDNQNINCDLNNVYDWWNQEWYPYYDYTIISPTYTQDKGAKAIKIVKQLMKKKLVKVNTVKQFVDLLDEIIMLL